MKNLKFICVLFPMPPTLCYKSSFTVKSRMIVITKRFINKEGEVQSTLFNSNFNYTKNWKNKVCAYFH